MRKSKSLIIILAVSTVISLQNNKSFSQPVIGDFHDRKFLLPQQISDAEARKIVAESFSQWKLSEGWQKPNQGGLEIIVPIEYAGQIISKLRIDSSNGNLIPIQDTAHASPPHFFISQAPQIAQNALSKISIGKKLRKSIQGNFWEVPLIYKGKEVGTIKVGKGTGKILPDWNLEEEASRFIPNR